MAKAKGYAITRLDGAAQSDRRCVAFLIGTGADGIDALDVFLALPERLDRDMRNRFDYWIGGGTRDQWFHGFPNEPRYSQCYTFKWRERRNRHRLYGFLCNPLTNSNPRFQVCVLVYHDVKNREHTDNAILDRINRLRGDPAVNVAIANEYPDSTKERKQWRN